MSLRALLLFVLWAPVAAWAGSSGLRLYENGEYEAAARAFEAVLGAAGSTGEERGQARMYLAASLHALGRVDAARRHLELLVREHPELRLDPARFLPELVALAEALRERVEAERRYAEATERERVARQKAELQRLADKPRPPWLRPEGLGLIEVTSGSVLAGTGLTYGWGPWEGSVRGWLRGPPLFHLQAGRLLGRGPFQPYVGVKGVLSWGGQGYGGGAVVGARYSLPAGFVAVLDVSAEYFFVTDENYEPLALTALAGLGFDVRLP